MTFVAMIAMHRFARFPRRRYSPVPIHLAPQVAALCLPVEIRQVHQLWSRKFRSSFTCSTSNLRLYFVVYMYMYLSSKPPLSRSPSNLPPAAVHPSSTPRTMSVDPHRRVSNEIDEIEEKDVELGVALGSLAAEVVEQDEGVNRIEALYLVFSKGWKLWILYGSITLISLAYALSTSTTYTFEAYAASSFESHPLIGAIAVAVAITAAVVLPIYAKIADITSRPLGLSLSILFYAIGYIVVAASKTIGALAGGEVIYTIGNGGINIIMTILIADLTSLQWRGFVQGLYGVPFVITTFVAGKIADGISANTVDGWRWGYGMFVIIFPVSMAPALVVLFWGDKKAKRLQALESQQISTPTTSQTPVGFNLATLTHYWHHVDAFGLILLATGFALLLLPLTLYSSAKSGWRNPSLIAMFVVGGVLFIAYFAWEMKWARHPMMPVRVLNKTFCALGGAFSGIAAQVASQASVPHQELAIAISLFLLWTTLGGAIGSAAAAAIWNAKLPANLNKYLGDQLNSTEIEEIFGSILVARGAEPRDLVIKAYDDTAFQLFLPSLVLSVLPLVAGLLTTDFYLGTQHNAVEDKEVRLREKEETVDAVTDKEKSMG
ncbi:major facilitator superfamily domain-containing protein [Favolaschia claudopus]|uniref:Major facilitator superfamily domain-containing protein n=1 Tax=Favolaschia claudopus TaxID=2862362 RepID=A0AAW0A766_9AGAR